MSGDALVDYIHTADVHSVGGALAGVRSLFGEKPPRSLLDVGCGTGTWMRAALDVGVGEVIGVDGVVAAAIAPAIDPALILRHDLSKRLDLGRKFDVALCLEVAEHLAERDAPTLIESLCAHSDLIYFSAACPGQHGQNHLNCQWPAYWQAMFNRQGFACDDAVRWRIWNDSAIEPWYRQNIFAARKDDTRAGAEPRIKPALHPEMLPYLTLMDRGQAESGALPVGWYVRSGARSLARKLGRLFG